MRWYHIIAKVCKLVGLYRLIPDRIENKTYLHRYYLLSTRWLAPVFPKLSYRVVLHHCVLSDIDGMHDHPWKWWCKVLEGGYWETVPDENGRRKRIWRDPSHGWRSQKAKDYHRLELPYDGASSWSLFIMGPKEKDWGFQDRDGNWIQWKEYIDNRDLYI